MSKYIKELTPEQEAILPEQVEKWVKIGHATDPMNMDRAIEGIKMVYKEASLEPPLVYMQAGSPVEAAIMGAVIRLYGTIWNEKRNLLKETK